MYPLIYKIPGPTVENMGKKLQKKKNSKLLSDEMIRIILHWGEKKATKLRNAFLGSHITLGIAPSSYKLNAISNFNSNVQISCY